MSGGNKQVKETPEEKELAKIAGERWTDYKQRFVPVENLAIKDVVDDLNNPSDFAPSMANLATQSQFSNAESGVARGLISSGRNLEGGLIGFNADRVASTGLAQGNAVGLDRGRNIGNLQTLVNLGQGQAGQAIQGMSTAADIAQRQAIMDARASAAARAAMGQMAGIGAGIAGGAYMNNTQVSPDVWTPTSSVPFRDPNPGMT